MSFLKSWGARCVLSLLLFVVVASSAEEADDLSPRWRGEREGVLDTDLDTERPVDDADPEAIKYRAASLDYDFSKEIIVFQGRAQIRHRTMELSAEKITYYKRTETLVAEGVPDSTGRLVGTPVLRDRDDTFYGEQMTYNMRTERGEVVKGRTAVEKGFYLGDQINSVADSIFYVESGSFTACDLEHAHYDFHTGRMKVLRDDKAIARSVMFRIKGVPVLWVPFYIFPLGKERHSGMLPPRYGRNSFDGWSIRNLGYYFAPGDHWDAMVKTSIRERTGWLLESRFRYASRYKFRGSVEFDLERSGGAWSDRSLTFEHTHELSETMTLRGSGRFAGSNFARRNSQDLYDRLNRTLRSHFTFDKRWQRSGNSLQIRLLHEKNLDNSSTMFSFPQIYFRKSRKSLFGSADRARFGRGGSRGRTKPESRRWYQAIYYTFNADLQRTLRKYSEGGETERRIEGRSTFGLSSQQRAFGWLSFTSRLNLNERWSRLRQEKVLRRDDLSANLSTNTTLYGLFQPRIGRLRAVRHVVKPDLSFSLRMSAQETGGFLGFGGKRRVLPRARTLRLRLGNILQVKTEHEGQDRKFDLVTLDFYTSYQFDAKDRKLSDLSTSFALKPDRRFDIRLSMSHDFYDEEGKLGVLRPRLRTLNINSSLRFSGRRGPEEGLSGALRGEEIGFPEVSPEWNLFGVERAFDSDLGRTGEPWQFRLSHNYRLSKFSGGRTTRSSWLKGSVGFSVATKWRIDYSFNYDLSPGVKKRSTAQTVSIYREFHCWEARLNVTPSGIRKGYYFKVNLTEFPEIKFERKGGRRSF